MKKSFTILLMLMTITCLAQESWKQESSPTNGNRWGAFYFSIGNKGYVGTGAVESSHRSDFWEYDPYYGVWTQKADFGGGVRAYGFGFSVGNKGYAGTGIVASYQWTKDMWEYDTAANTWTPKDDFKGGLRYELAGFTIGNKAYVGTGEYRESPYVLSTYFNDFWEFDPAAPVGSQWTQKANVPEEGRTHARGMSIGNKGYIGFGVYYYDTRKNDWWQYDPSADTWTRKADLPTDGKYNPSLFSIGNKGYLVGGSYYGPLKDFWEYNATTDMWTQKDDFPGEARYHGVGLTIGNRGYVGFGVSNLSLGDWWEFRTYQVSISCPHDTVVSASGTCNAVVNDLDPAYSPTGENPLVTYSIIYNGSMIASGLGTASGKTFNLGTSYVYYYLPNWEQTCSFTVSVVDNTKPVVTCPSAQKLCYRDDNNYTIPLLTAKDNCGLQSITYAITGATVRNGIGSNASGAFNTGVSTIRWRVTDNAGNFNECTTSVTVNPRLTVSIPDTYSLLIWGRVNTVFIGFGPTCAPLVAVPTGGTPYQGLNAYRYSWSNGGKLIATLACPPMVPGSYTFTVTVTDAAGCTATASKAIRVVDARCGPKNNEVLICWFGRSQSCYQQWQVILAMAYGVGAQIGPCNLYAPTEVQKQNNVKEGLVLADKMVVYPNPSGQYFNLNVQSVKTEQLQVKIIDAFGREMEQLKGSANKTYTFGHQYKPGIYIVEVQLGVEKQVFKVIKL